MAAANVDIDIGIGPPPPRYEVVPDPRPGYILTPGYWDWRGDRHYWVDGTWVRQRRGYVYSEPTWVNHGDRWQYNRGGWSRRGDRDRLDWEDRNHDHR